MYRKLGEDDVGQHMHEMSCCDDVGGEETVLTSALNWYVNDAVRFMFEWSHILDTDRSSQLRREAEGMEIIQFRSQFTF